MAISGVQAAQNTYQTVTTIRNRQNQTATLLNAPAPRQDKVSLSEEAKELSQSLRQPEGSGETASGGQASQQDLPLEAYSLPQWYVDLSSDLLLVDDQIGVPYSQSRQASYDALSSREKDDLSEYQGILHSYFQDELRNQGIDNTADYYSQIVQNPQQSEEVHQAVLQRLRGDDRALQLMDYFGISLS